MPWSGLLVFAVIYLMATASPGPAVVAVVARGLGRGTAGMAPFIAGCVAGDIVWFAAAAAGLAFVAERMFAVLLLIRFAGAAYLLFLAYSLWTAHAAPIELGEAPRSERPLTVFAGALSMTLSNPKVIVFFLAILPGVLPLERITAGRGAVVAVCMAFILSGVLASYGLAAARARRLFGSPRGLQRLNRSAGVVMAGAAVAVIAR